MTNKRLIERAGGVGIVAITKANKWILGVVLCLLGPFACLAQTYPPNDNFTNRTELIGTDITFSGPSIPATVENPQEYALAKDYVSSLVAPNQSVWWKWTAPVSTSLTLQVLRYSDPLTNTGSGQGNVLFIYSSTNSGTNLNINDLNPTPLANAYISPVFVDESTSFSVTAGTEYEIQFIGYGLLNASWRLIATNAPVIVQQPISQTVYSNTSTIFYVVYAGANQASFTFQWRLNGTNLPDETTPILSLTNIDGSMAGQYSVVVSNGADYTISQPAALAVSQSNVPISLGLMGMSSNKFRFSLTGENGRYYRFQASTNLVDWNIERGYPFGIDLYAINVMFNSNSPSLIEITNAFPRKFFRARPYVTGSPEAEICINNLQQLHIASILLARDSKTPPYSPITYFGSLTPYLPHHTLPICPEDIYQTPGTSYSLYNLQFSPTCNVEPTNHILEFYK